MPYVVRIATPEDRDLVVTALRASAEQRVRVARKAGGKVAADKRAGKEVRAAAVRVAMLLAEADTLEQTATDLEAATEVAVLSVDQAGRIETTPIPDPTADTPPGDVDTDTDVDDDGTSPQAQHLAELAGLKPTDPDAEDPITHALPEDEPDTVEDIDL